MALSADAAIPGTPDRRLMNYRSLPGIFTIFSTTISKNPVLPMFSQN
ncbi:MAG TPA: hypothetical protein P5013_05770 [Methanoregula sp.]|nr:hypothetical protein [Methanoregula sp.]